MLSDAEIKEIRDKDHKVLKEVNNKADELLGKKTDEIQKRFDSIKGQISDLQDEKEALLRGPMTKEETLLLALESWKSVKEMALDTLKSHLSDCQNRANTPLNEFAMKYLLDERRSWKLASLLITEEAIREAVQLLPDIGMSATDRQAAIAAIDKKISKVALSMEKDT